jgi:DNA-binding transcriptional LysR family regulator
MASYLPEDLSSFLALFPQVRIEIDESTSPETLRAIAENAADIGIYGDVVVPTELSSFVYRQDRLALLVPTGHALEPREAVGFSDTVGYEFIGTPRGSSIDTALLRASADIGISLRMAIRSSGFYAISRLVDAGLGIAVMPESVATLYARSMAVKALALDEQWAQRRLMICVRDHATLTPPAAAFLAHLTRPVDISA